jgi:hypothetical protein
VNKVDAKRERARRAEGWGGGGVHSSASKVLLADAAADLDEQRTLRCCEYACHTTFPADNSAYLGSASIMLPGGGWGRRT